MSSNKLKSNSRNSEKIDGMVNEEVVEKSTENIDTGKSCQHSNTPKAWSDYSGGVQARVIEGPGIYYMGIIDMLQEWDFWKQLERFIKTKLLRKDPKGISAIDPYQYQRRFMDRIREIIKDESYFLKSNNVDVKAFKEKSFEVYIWPTMKKVQDNLVEALHCRTAAQRRVLPKLPAAEKRPRLRSSPVNWLFEREIVGGTGSVSKQQFKSHSIGDFKELGFHPNNSLSKPTEVSLQKFK